MRELTLVVVPDCPLSDHARQVLETLAAEGLLGWRELATEAPTAKRSNVSAPALLPALLDESGRMIAQGRLSERALRQAFAPDQSGVA
jgi:hypothetical protein